MSESEPGFVRQTVDHDSTVNVAYLSLLCLLCFDLLASTVSMGAGFYSQYTASDHSYPFTGVATVLTAIWGTFSTALGAVGIFLWGNRGAQQ